MNTKINTILPIALALILPGLGYYANSEAGVLEQIGLLESWLVGSCSLFILWYILWYMWEWTQNYEKWWYLFYPVALIGIVFSFSYLLVFKNFGDFKWLSVIRIIFPSIVFLAIQYALRAQQNIAKLELEKEQIQTENYKAQLKALRAKIDPHFLFNSLNTLRSMVRHQHANSEKFIMSLSDFYRQTLKHDENTTLSLSEELAVLQSFLFLMKSRNEEAVSVKIDVDAELHQLHLPTLALQVVVENCFKHNSMTSKRPLFINITNTDDNYIEVSNNIQPKIGDQESSGMGLDLLRKRYGLMNIQNGVVVEETNDHFMVKLKLI